MDNNLGIKSWINLKSCATIILKRGWNWKRAHRIGNLPRFCVRPTLGVLQLALTRNAIFSPNFSKVAQKVSRHCKWNGHKNIGSVSSDLIWRGECKRPKRPYLIFLNLMTFMTSYYIINAFTACFCCHENMSLAVGHSDSQIWVIKSKLNSPNARDSYPSERGTFL